MGQCATLHRTTSVFFREFTANPGNFSGLAKDKGHKTFDQSFEGLRFILSKNQDPENINLATQIFYPETCTEEEDLSDFDFTNVPVDFDYESKSIYYHDPAKVTAIAQLLETISIEHFRGLFDPDELNKNEIYPAGVWNKKTGEDQAFNESYILQEFEYLKEFFISARNEGDYILSFVG